MTSEHDRDLVRKSSSRFALLSAPGPCLAASPSPHLAASPSPRTPVLRIKRSNGATSPGSRIPVLRIKPSNWAASPGSRAPIPRTKASNGMKAARLRVSKRFLWLNESYLFSYASASREILDDFCPQGGGFRPRSAAWGYSANSGARQFILKWAADHRGSSAEGDLSEKLEALTDLSRGLALAFPKHLREPDKADPAAASAESGLSRR